MKQSLGNTHCGNICENPKVTSNSKAYNNDYSFKRLNLHLIIPLLALDTKNVQVKAQAKPFVLDNYFHKILLNY